jgi:hypothetical protein
MGEAALASAWMVAAQVTDAGLKFGGHLVRTVVGAMRAVSQRVQPAGGLTT